VSRERLGERKRSRRGAHLFGLTAESIAALLLRLKGTRSLSRTENNQIASIS
jgi:hypothetical protein